MNYQRSNWSENYSCGCSCEGRSRSNTQPWTRRNWDACGCGTTARTGCGCTNNNARTGCGCANNNTRTGCGCTNNNTRTGCGRGSNADKADILPEKRNCPCPNQGTEWRNRSGCPCAQARTNTCPGTPCNTGARDHGFLNGQSLAMVYSPYQHFQELYDPREGLCSGTIFTELNKPFCPKCGC